MSTCDQGFKKSKAIYWGRIGLVNHVMHPPALGLQATTPVGSPRPLSIRPPAITMGRDVEVQNTHMIRCWTFTALVSYSSVPGSRWVKAKPLLLCIFIFLRQRSVLGRLFLRLGELRLLSGLWRKAIIKLTFTPLLNWSKWWWVKVTSQRSADSASLPVICLLSKLRDYSANCQN